MNDSLLRSTGLVCLAAVLVHGADHVRRDLAFTTGSLFESEVITPLVRSAGAIQFVLVVVAVVLVLRRHPVAPLAAAAVGIPGAILFVAAHLLPQWSDFSDAFVGSQVGLGVSAFSWFTALFEIAANLAFAAAGVAVLRARAGTGARSVAT